jgi:hypothetical protein
MSFCKNCGEKVVGNYCSQCGQKTQEERITFHHIWHGLVHFITHAEKGFFYTTGELIKRPGNVVTNFIGGNRAKYQSPVSYFLIWNAVYILLLYIANSLFGENEAVDFEGYFGPGEKTSFAISHLNIVLMCLLPFQAVYVWLILVYKRYNYFEAFVLVLYSIGTVMLWQCLFVLLAVIIHVVSGASVNIRLSDIIKVVYAGWFLFDFAGKLNIKRKLLRVIAVLILIGGTFTVWRLFIYPSVVELFFN